jgi:mannose-1-phosphate guanylyltransferase
MGDKNTWGIVLAAGEGNRVREFLSALCGGRGIKQFCSVLGNRSLLQMTLDRVQQLIPRERILIIVDKQHRPEAAAQLAGWPAENIIYQPANRETAAGILLPLAHVSHRCPDATVAVFPSDHFIVNERGFMTHVAHALEEIKVFPQSAVLLGMTPDRMEEGYGWISTREDRKDNYSRAVRAFWEKPALPDAEKLMRDGALWNTFVFAARAATLWEMTRQTVPELYGIFCGVRIMLGTTMAQKYINQSYERLRPVNFSSAILARCAARLRVLPVPETGWSDWGSADRILGSAMRMGRVGELSARLKKQSVVDPSMATLLSRYRVYSEQAVCENLAIASTSKTPRRDRDQISASSLIKTL